jgi:hypothetical protein
MSWTWNECCRTSRSLRSSCSLFHLMKTRTPRRMSFDSCIAWMNPRRPWPRGAWLVAPEGGVTGPPGASGSFGGGRSSVTDGGRAVGLAIRRVQKDPGFSAPCGFAGLPPELEHAQVAGQSPPVKKQNPDGFASRTTVGRIDPTPTEPLTVERSREEAFAAPKPRIRTGARFIPRAPSLGAAWSLEWVTVRSSFHY